MPTPSPRNSIRIARGNYADLSASVADIGEGELCFALDQDKFYSKSGGVLVEVGKGTALYSLNQLGDVSVGSASTGEYLQWNGSAWVPAAGGGGGAVDSVNSQTGVVVLDADDISDAATTNKYTTAADISKLAGIEAGAEVNVVDSVAGKVGAVTLAKADITDFSDGDYATAAQGTTADSALQPADIGVTVQGYDADNVVSDVAPTFTATVQTTERAISAGSFDLSTGNHWSCGAITVPAPSNAVEGTAGLIRITSGPVVWNQAFKFPNNTAPTLTTFPCVIPFYVQGPTEILMGNVTEFDVAATDADFASVVLLLHGEGSDGGTTFTDSSTGNLTLTPVGSVTTSTTQAKFGSSSISFPGSCNLNYPSASGSELDVALNESYTLEFWMYITAFADVGLTSSSVYAFWEANSSTTTNRHSLNLVSSSSSSGQARIRWQQSYSSTGAFEHQDTVPTNQWVHIAVVRSNSSEIRLYVDGVKSTSFGDSNEALDNSSFWSFGPRQTASNQFYVDDLRFTVGVARYVADFTPPGATFPDA